MPTNIDTFDSDDIGFEHLNHSEVENTLYSRTGIFLLRDTEGADWLLHFLGSNFASSKF